MKPRKSFLRTLPVVLIGLALCLPGPCPGEDVCFQCHERAAFQKKVVHRPVAEGKCGGCHNPHVARHKGLLQKAGARLCHSCHLAETVAGTKEVVHQPVRQGQCLACHEAHASDAGHLLDARLSETCLGCHKNLARRYKNTHAPFAKGNCTACHEPHEAGNPQLLKGEPNAVCVSCHAGDRVRQAHPSYPMPLNDCLSCHTPHGSGRRALVRDNLHAPFEKGCGTCHGKGDMGMELCLECHKEVNAQIRAAHGHLLRVKGNSCTTCHSPHTGNEPNLLRGGQKQICWPCHKGTFARYDDRLHIHPEAHDCKECHAVHGSSNLAMLKDGGNETCSRCHETQGKFSHPVGEKVLDPRTDQIMTCVSCHQPMGTDFRYNLKLSGEKDLCIQCHRTY